MWRRTFLDQFGQDLRYAFRMMRRSPGFTAAAALSLALCIGANTAIFSVIDAMLLKTLPVRNPEELVMLRLKRGSPNSQYDIYHPRYEKIRDQTQVYTEVSANWLIDRTVTINGPGGGTDAKQFRVNLASGNYFSTLGVDAAIGRMFTSEDDRVPGGHPVTVISDGYWERMFGRSADVVGRTLTLNKTVYTIIGVAQRGFSGTWLGKPVDMWIPFMMQLQVMPEVPGLQRYPTRIIARLKPGVTIEQARAASALTYQRALTDEAGANPTPEQLQQIAQQGIDIESAARGHSLQRKSYTQTLGIMMAAVGLVLLIACVNVANLLLARAIARRKEIGVRLAMGASRSRIIRQLLTESVLLAMIGGLLGLLFAQWGSKNLMKIIASGPMGVRSDSVPLPFLVSLSIDVHPDMRIFAFTLVLGLLTGILFGLAPAYRSSKTPLTQSLSGRGTSAGKPGRPHLGKTLVIAQVALSLIFLICAGLLVSTLHNLRSQDLKFERQNLLLVWISPVQTGRTVPALADFSKTLQDRLTAVPGVVSVGMTIGGVLAGRDDVGDRSEHLKIEGKESKPGLLLMDLTVTPKFFQTVGIPLVAGRDLTDSDSETAPRVAVISETYARFFFGNENPIGRRIGWEGEDGHNTEIVGVVKDAKHGTPRDSRGVAYGTFRQKIRVLRGTWCVAVRTMGDAIGMAARLREEFRNIDPGLPLLNINTIEDQLDNALVQERLFSSIFSSLSGLAALLACLGLYGTISNLVTLRTNEIGLRMALGATRANVLWMVLKESLWLVVIGIMIGIPVTLVATRLIASRLFGVSATDPLTIASAALLMIFVAALAGLIPARKASRVDPMEALRYE